MINTSVCEPAECGSEGERKLKMSRMMSRNYLKTIKGPILLAAFYYALVTL